VVFAFNAALTALEHHQGCTFRGAKMAVHRAFFVESDGNFRESVSFDCTSDSAAIEQAQRLTERQNIQFWTGHRMIAALASDSSGRQRVFA
jgi:hypothetical protein